MSTLPCFLTQTAIPTDGAGPATGAVFCLCPSKSPTYPT